ncbi:hypothetical protein HPB50_002185 [Hyalomma asiaticum]|uniref:Uncharacterized protein n=1 Tax=Hyalomma asiaticum TaxID=266040 RepID=A0ACB7RIY0_HYAAI|nr:hypothetical protein HPB50_002185 [Hyalomma asiaticum]
MQYGQQDPYAPPAGGVYTPGATYAPQPAAGPYVDPAYAASQPQLAQPQLAQAQLAQPAMYGPQPYAAPPYGPPVMPAPSDPAMAPFETYDPGYANYLYGLQSRDARRYLIQSPSRRKIPFNTNRILTVLVVCGTLFFVFIIMLLVVTVIVPRITRRHHAGHRRRHEFPNEIDNLADADLPVDAPQLGALSNDEQEEAKLGSSSAKHGSKHGHKDPDMARHVRSRAKG